MRNLKIENIKEKLATVASAGLLLLLLGFYFYDAMIKPKYDPEVNAISKKDVEIHVSEGIRVTISQELCKTPGICYYIEINENVSEASFSLKIPRTHSEYLYAVVNNIPSGYCMEIIEAKKQYEDYQETTVVSYDPDGYVKEDYVKCYQNDEIINEIYVHPEPPTLGTIIEKSFVGVSMSRRFTIKKVEFVFRKIWFW